MTVNVITANPWWQVKDADVSSNGDITSGVPTALYFNLLGDGGFPGAVIYGGTTNLTSSNVSATHWLANSSFNTNKVFGSTYFINSIPADATQNNLASSTFDQTALNAGVTSGDGYKWFTYDASTNGGAALDISAINLGTTKVILIVKNGNINVNGNIILTDGRGFFLAVTTGNIAIAPTVGGGGVANLEGVYVADGTISTGSLGASSDSRLWLRGSAIGYGGINLQRDLADNSVSSEFFEYAPDQELLFPVSLSTRATNWREIAP